MPEYWKQKVIYINVESSGAYQFYFLFNFHDPFPMDQEYNVFSLQPFPYFFLSFQLTLIPLIPSKVI